MAVPTSTCLETARRSTSLTNERFVLKTYDTDCIATQLRSWCEGLGGRSVLPVFNSPYGFFGRKATLN